MDERPEMPDRQRALNHGPAGSDAEAAHSTPWLGRALYYLFFAGLLAYLFLSVDGGKLAAGLKAAVGLGLVVFFHELGHFLTAKWCDVHVETFSIGFGPPLPGCSVRWGETTYMIALFPLGGYVKMVGEGADADEQEDDPRSFRNKPVWQRMLIISSGVSMNVLLALACFVYVYRTHGAEKSPGIVDVVDPGSPAWKAGVRTGDVIRWIGTKGPDPYFDDLRPVVVNSREGERLNFVWGPPDAPESRLHHTQIEPKRIEEEARPVIGIAPPSELALSAEGRKERSSPTLSDSAAARSEPPFDFGDLIVGTTDPAHPEQVSALPPDPRHRGYPDYFEFERRMEQLRGREVVIRVRRDGSTRDLRVPPAYHRVFGLRMRMGKVTAVRDDSPAARAGVRSEDIIDRVEIRGADGRTIRYSAAPVKTAAPDGATEKALDPLRLPDDLEAWAAGLAQGAPRQVTLQVLRNNPVSGSHSERQMTTLHCGWDESWRFDREVPVTASSPLSIPELGIAYRVETRVQYVAPQSPATRAKVERSALLRYQKGDEIRRDGASITAEEGQALNLKPGDEINIREGDVIKAVRFHFPGRTVDAASSPGEWGPVQADQWAWVFVTFQLLDVKKCSFRLERDDLEVSLQAQPDPQWPLAERGLLLAPDVRLQRADSLADALRMGLDATLDWIVQTYQMLHGIVTGRISPKMVGGPIIIAKAAYLKASQNVFQLLIFLGIISINLAVINFLPIPVLDGGHMVFLIYERLRGRPAPRRVQEAATYVGLAFILCLVVAVFYMDIKRF